MKSVYQIKLLVTKMYCYGLDCTKSCIFIYLVNLVYTNQATLCNGSKDLLCQQIVLNKTELIRSLHCLCE